MSLPVQTKPETRVDLSRSATLSLRLLQRVLDRVVPVGALHQVQRLFHSFWHAGVNKLQSPGLNQTTRQNQKGLTEPPGFSEVPPSKLGRPCFVLSPIWRSVLVRREATCYSAEAVVWWLREWFPKPREAIGIDGKLPHPTRLIQHPSISIQKNLRRTWKPLSFKAPPKK